MSNYITQEQVSEYCIDYIKGRSSGLLLADKFNALYDSVAVGKYKDVDREVARRRLLARSIIIDCIMPLNKWQLERLETTLLQIADTIP